MQQFYNGGKYRNTAILAISTVMVEGGLQNNFSIHPSIYRFISDIIMSIEKHTKKVEIRMHLI